MPQVYCALADADKVLRKSSNEVLGEADMVLYASRMSILYVTYSLVGAEILRDTVPHCAGPTADCRFQSRHAVSGAHGLPQLIARILQECLLR